MAGVEGISPGRSSLDQHRFVVAGATFDECDRRQDVDGSNTDISVASTVDVDNTHPYLMRYADVYANDNSDASSVGTGPTFVGVKPASRFKRGQKVLYTGNNGPSEAIVVRVLYDDENQSHYTIKLASGKEEQAESARLNRKTASKGATDENGEAPKQCASFKTDPTPLFQSLYQGLWHTAHQLLLSNPEQARVWVARYATIGPGSFDGGGVRWQLLPLHLFVALSGHSNEDASKPEDVDIPDDEKDRIQQMEKENEGEKSPPMRLLTALLSAYPQATQCADDQNMIPLQSAIRGNVPLSIIEKLLEVDPSSVYRKDGRGRNAFALSEKIFEKHVHEKQVGNEDTAREMRYAKLTKLLSDAARRASSPAKSRPKEKAQGVQKKPQEENTVNQRLKTLQNENLALRRENAELRHRSHINTNLLQQLVEKLQMYEDQRSIDIENYNEIFGSKDELIERREGILLSISEDDDAQERNTVEGEGEGEGENEHTTEEKQVGGEGAYHKRLERYLTSPTSNKGNINIISPSSIMAEAMEPDNKNSPVSTATGATEPVTPHSPSVLIPNLESSDNYDANNSADAEANNGNGNKTGGDDIRSCGKASSESDESSESNTEGQYIFRPRNDDTKDCTLDNSQSHKEIERHPDDSSRAVARPSDTVVDDIDMSEKDDDVIIADSQSESTFASEPNVEIGLTDTNGKDTSSERPIVSTAFSEKEVDQLCVE